MAAQKGNHAARLETTTHLGVPWAQQGEIAIQHAVARHQLQAWGAADGR